MKCKEMKDSPEKCGGPAGGRRLSEQAEPSGRTDDGFRRELDALSLSPTREALEAWLQERNPERVAGLIREAWRRKQEAAGPGISLRGLIEISNRCRKNCLYCGIRRDNASVHRYALDEEEIVALGRKASALGYGSLVLQGGEREDAAFVASVTRLLRRLKALDSFGITLSFGEQREEVYREWFEAGAHRYLLRIESSDPALYARIHPQDADHRYARRIECLQALRRCGYQVGTGVMIGLPYQTLGHLASDLLFFRETDIDMCGMGPYIPHRETPLAAVAAGIPGPQERMELSIRMVALLRILMPDINIAATTALQVLDPRGRERAVDAGANVVMPNLTDLAFRGDYDLYDGKPGASVDADLTGSPFARYLEERKIPILRREWGDSRHFAARKGKD